MNLTWEQSSDELLVNAYRPLPQLLASRIKSKQVQEALTSGNLARFRVEQERFWLTLANSQAKSRLLPNVPDLEIQVQRNESGVLVATLTSDSRKRLQAIGNGEESISDNIGVTKSRKLPLRQVHSEPKPTPTTSRKDLAKKYAVSEEVIQNWCSLCSLRSSLTVFTADGLERLELYKRLTDAGITVRDIRLIFRHWQ
jgi:hypothetical protein